jgi:glycosyltransferase involved in cell wall biosynthesis
MNAKESSRLIFVGPFKFPDASASTRRITGIGLSLSQIGYKVLVGAGQTKEGTKDLPDAAISRFSTYSLNELPESSAPRLKKLIQFFTMGRKTLQWLNALDPRPFGVFLFGGYSPYSRLILPWCRRYKIPLIVDVVEWFEPSHLPGGWWGPFHWNNEIALRYYYVKARNIIAISQYLERYYKSKGCHTLRMPPTLDVRTISSNLNVTNKQITLAYAGFPGKKDLLNNIVEGIFQIDPQGKRIRLVLAGPNPENTLRLQALYSRRLRRIPDWMEVHGSLPFIDALEVVRNADFMPLLRPPLRYAQAGFPTKVPESLSVGTPIICNLTSDLGNYIQNGVEGIICRDHSSNAFADALEQALSLTIKQRTDMRHAARKQAERSFDYRLYTEPLAAFLMNLQ